VRVISGSFGGKQGFMTGEHVRMTMLDIRMDAGKEFQMVTPQNETLFTYLMSGSGFFGVSRQEMQEKRAVLFTRGDEAAFSAGDRGLRLVLFMGAPLQEPIAWGGPIVMNTREELRQAFEELDRGTFIK
jgi:hypothetical protein